jgi:hypothetical protein
MLKMPKMNATTLDAFECDVMRQAPQLWCIAAVDRIGDTDPVFLEATNRLATGMAGSDSEIAAYVAGAIQFGAMYAHEAIRTQFEVDELEGTPDAVIDYFWASEDPRVPPFEGGAGI